MNIAQIYMKRQPTVQDIIYRLLYQNDKETNIIQNAYVTRSPATL